MSPRMVLFTRPLLIVRKDVLTLAQKKYSELTGYRMLKVVE
jgi:hypothetical protein